MRIQCVTGFANKKFGLEETLGQKPKYYEDGVVFTEIHRPGKRKPGFPTADDGNKRFNPDGLPKGDPELLLKDRVPTDPSKDPFGSRQKEAGTKGDWFDDVLKWIDGIDDRFDPSK